MKKIQKKRLLKKKVQAWAEFADGLRESNGKSQGAKRNRQKPNFIRCSTTNLAIEFNEGADTTMNPEEIWDLEKQFGVINVENEGWVLERIKEIEERVERSRESALAL